MKLTVKENEWWCAGCGVASPDRIQRCDCPTNVVCIGVGPTQKSAWKHLISSTELIERTGGNAGPVDTTFPPEMRKSETALLMAAAAPELAWFTEQILNGIDTDLLHIDTPADETLANVLRRGRIALAKAQGRFALKEQEQGR